MAYYKHRVRKTKEYTYTPLPLWGTLGIVTFLENHDIPYEVLDDLDLILRNDEMANKLPLTWVFNGESGTEECVYIKTKVNGDDIHEIAEQTDSLTPEEIGNKWSPILDESAFNDTPKQKVDSDLGAGIPEYELASMYTRDFLKKAGYTDKKIDALVNEYKGKKTETLRKMGRSEEYITDYFKDMEWAWEYNS